MVMSHLCPGARSHLELLYQLHLQRHEPIVQFSDVLTVFHYLRLNIGQFRLITYST